MIGFDIGGAHVKAADHTGRAHTEPFPMWKQPHQLEQVLQRIVARFGPADRYAVTMTGELADCFFDRGEGVRRIVDAVQGVLGDAAQFYAVDGRFLSADEAKADDALVAASNWHAMATLAARMCDGEGLLIDIGSTTTDLIPFASGRVATSSRTDRDRLCRGELLYVGIGRTPVCALVEMLPYLGEQSPVMNEVFATTDDCALLTGLSDPDETDTDTSDGQPRTVIAATNRMARMIGLDHRTVTPEDAAIMAAVVIQRMRARVMVSAQVLSPPAATWVLAGHGSCMLSVPPDRRCLDIAAALTDQISRVGPAYAVACLAKAEDTRNSPCPRLSTAITDGKAIRDSRTTGARKHRRSTTSRRVIKVGGSLFSHASLVEAMDQWLIGQSAAENFIIVGGGEAVEAMRELSQRFALDEAAMHWRCIRLLRATYELASELFGHWQQIDDRDAFDAITAEPPQPGHWLVAVDAFYSPATQDDSGLPESWATTSDAIAAYLARLIGADELVLLKPCHVAPAADLDSLAAAGVVDEAFAPALPPDVEVRIEQLRVV